MRSQSKLFPHSVASIKVFYHNNLRKSEDTIVQSFPLYGSIILQSVHLRIHDSVTYKVLIFDNLKVDDTEGKLLFGKMNNVLHSGLQVTAYIISCSTVKQEFPNPRREDVL